MKISSLIQSLIVAASVGLFALPAQAVVVLDSLDNTVTVTSNIGTTANAGKAINFIMPLGLDYLLDNVVLDLSSVENNESPLVQIWSNHAGSSPIDSLLETLVNPGTLVNGLNTFTSSGLLLEDGTTYWLVVQNLANSFGWPASSDTSIESAIGATHNGRLFPNGNNSQPDPDQWTSTSGVLNRAQINATALVTIPEPATGLLACLGLGGLMIRRRQVA